MNTSPITKPGPILHRVEKTGKRFLKKDGLPKRLLLVFVLIPTLVTFFYLAFLYTPMFISNCRFAVRSSDGSELASIPALFSQVGINSPTLDAHIVADYIQSMDMLEHVDAAVDLRRHFSGSGKDIVSRLGADVSKEEFLQYWQWLVTTIYNPEKGYIAVEVKAYTPEMARRINQEILSRSENLVNQMNFRAHQDAVRLAEEQVEKAEGRLLQAQAQIRAFRDSTSILDPKATAEGLEKLIAKLEGDAAVTEAELNATLESMRQNSPRVQALKTKLKSLHEQVAREKARLAGLNKDSAALSSLVGDFAQLQTEEQFAQEYLVKSMTALEAARLKAIAQSRYIVPFQPPTLPDEALYPPVFEYTLITFIGLFLLLGVLSLIIAAICDRMGM